MPTPLQRLRDYGRKGDGKKLGRMKWSKQTKLVNVISGMGVQVFEAMKLMGENLGQGLKNTTSGIDTEARLVNLEKKLEKQEESAQERATEERIGPEKTNEALAMILAKLQEKS